MSVCDVDGECVRFRTNPDLGATEKLTVCDPSSSHMLETDYTPLPMLHPGFFFKGYCNTLDFILSMPSQYQVSCHRSIVPGTDADLAPFSVGFVKGWRRATALLSVMAAIKDLEIPTEEIPRQFQAL